MAEIQEQIPESLRTAVDAAVAWLEALDGHSYSVSGIVEAEETLLQLRRLLCKPAATDTSCAAA